MPLSSDDIRAKLPLLLDWITQTLRTHARHARSVTSVGFQRLPAYFKLTTLNTAKVVVVEELPVPPLTRLGLGQFAEMESLDAGGMTYLDTFFVTADSAASESLHLHELIHVVQWRVLGPEQFLTRYADGLERFGYRFSPLEVMAYDAEARFQRGELFDAEALVHTALRTL